MPSLKSKKEHPFLPLFEKFIGNSKNGKRLQANGKRITPGTIRNYATTLRLLQEFEGSRHFPLRIREERYLNARETEQEQRYWKMFYRQFTEYLYLKKGYNDNYVGSMIKNCKTFFNYLNREAKVKIGSFHKQLFVRKEEIPIFPLMPEELNYLIFNANFESSLSERMKEVKDVFVFGCTVALRVSDLLRLKRQDLRIVDNHLYLAVRSQKSSTDTLIKLPAYCREIIQRYKKSRRFSQAILPHFNASNLNQYIKQLLEKAGFVQEVRVTRTKGGKQIELRNSKRPNGRFRFCDVASTHTMRRTAITTMLCLGMPEPLVRKISGHAPGSKDFYRYLFLAQTYQDQETERVFSLLENKSAIKLTTSP